LVHLVHRLPVERGKRIDQIPAKKFRAIFRITVSDSDAKLAAFLMFISYTQYIKNAVSISHFKTKLKAFLLS